VLLGFRQGKRRLHAARRRKQRRPGRLQREQGRREGTLDGEGMGRMRGFVRARGTGPAWFAAGISRRFAADGGEGIAAATKHHGGAPAGAPTARPPVPNNPIRDAYTSRRTKRAQGGDSYRRVRSVELRPRQQTNPRRHPTPARNPVDAGGAHTKLRTHTQSARASELQSRLPRSKNGNVSRNRRGGNPSLSLRVISTCAVNCDPKASGG
jgi:hypothetical protein